MLCEVSIANVPFFVGAIFQTNVCSFSDNFCSVHVQTLGFFSFFCLGIFANLGKKQKKEKREKKTKLKRERGAIESKFFDLSFLPTYYFSRLAIRISTVRSSSSSSSCR